MQIYTPSEAALDLPGFAAWSEVTSASMTEDMPFGLTLKVQRGPRGDQLAPAALVIFQLLRRCLCRCLPRRPQAMLCW